MKKKPAVKLGICFILAAGLVFVKPLIIVIAKKQLGSVFVQSRVSISKCALWPLNRLGLSGIEISRQGAYDIKVKEAFLEYNPLELFKPPFLRLTLKDTGVYLNAPQKKISEIPGYFNIAQKGPQILKSVDISGLSLDITTQDLSLKANASLALNLARQAFDSLNFNVGFFKMFGAQMENASLQLKDASGEGNFVIPQFKYDKLIVSDIKGRIKLAAMSLSLYDVSAKILEGDIAGRLDLKAGKELQYLLDLNCFGLNIERFINDFNLREKFSMTGRLSGGLRLQGRGSHIEILGGNFSALPSGGTLVINNTVFLENMARDTRQPVNLLVESFKNYTYNTGLMSLDLKDNDIVFKAGLEGEAGRRELSVVVHDFRF